MFFLNKWPSLGCLDDHQAKSLMRRVQSPRIK